MKWIISSLLALIMLIGCTSTSRYSYMTDSELSKEYFRRSLSENCNDAKHIYNDALQRETDVRFTNIIANLVTGDEEAHYTITVTSVINGRQYQHQAECDKYTNES